MKKLIVLFCLLAVSAIKAQAPQYLNYQGIARDAGGTIITTAIGVKFEILQGSASGAVVYDETNTITPSSAGIFTTAIGSGAAGIGTFSLITWANGPYYIRVNIDPAGGTSYSTVGTSQLLSVPYALYAEKAGNTQTVNISGSSVTGTYPNYTITAPGALTPSTGISIVGGTITNTAPNTTLTPSGIASVTGAHPSFTINVPPPSLNYNTGTNVLTLTQGTAVATTTLVGAGSNTVAMFAQGIASVSPIGAGSNFTVSVQSPSFTSVGATSVTGTYPNFVINSPGASTTIPTSLQINSPHTTTTLSPNNFSVNVVPTTITGAGVTGSYPNYTLTASPSTSITSGSANIIVSGAAPSYTISNTIPTLSLTGSTLSSGPLTNSVNLSSLSVWSNSVGVLYPTVLTNSVGIGTSTASSVLDVTGNSTLTVGKFTNSTNTGGAVITADHVGGSSAATYYGVKASANASGGSTYGLYGSAGGGGTAYGVYGSMNGAGGYGVYGYSPAGGNGVGVGGVSTSAAPTAYGVYGSSSNSYGGYFQNSGGTIVASLGGQTYSGIFSGGNVGIGVTNPGYRLAVNEASGALPAVYATQSSAAGSANAHGIMGLTSNTNTFAAGVHGESTGAGPAVSGSKLSGSGNAGRFEITSTTNTADGLFSTTSGGGAAMHAVNGPTVAGGSNAGLWLEAGHLKSTQSIAPTTNTLTVSGGGISSATVSLSAGSTDVKGTLLAVITTTGIINQNNNFVVRVNFNKAYASPPIVVMTPASDNGVLHPFISGVSATSFTVTFKNPTTTNMGATSPFSVNYNYMVIE